MITVVNSGDTLYSISKQSGVPVSKIIADNGLVSDILVTGQSLILEPAKESIVTNSETTVSDTSREFSTDIKKLFRDNYILLGKNDIPKGTFIVLEYINTPETEKIIGGYSYDFISKDRLDAVINYLTYLIPFTYGFTPNGELIAPFDAILIETAKSVGVGTLMHVSTLTPEGTFDSNLPSVVFSDEESVLRLTDNIISQVLKMEYDGVDIDFEYLPESQKQNYVNFISILSEKLHDIGKILVVAVPPKTSDNQRGLLVEGIDYDMLGRFADYIMIMAYEYGYKFGPPLAIAPIDQVRNVLDYATIKIPQSKILLGIPNYGYNWLLPYERGISDAPSISTSQAIELAKKYGAEIMFDEVAMAPYFFYTDENGRVHEVWFEDARSFEAKMDLIKEYGLAGGFIWDLMRDNPQGFVTINSAIKIE